MCRALIIIVLFLLTGCKTVISSPLNVTYTGTIDEKGLSITAKPPGWDVAVVMWANLKKWVNE